MMACLFGLGVLLVTPFVDQVAATRNAAEESDDLLKCRPNNDDARVYNPYFYGRESTRGFFNFDEYEESIESRDRCEDATSATGGSYTSLSKTMCVVSFHQSTSSNHGAYKLSNVCADENEVEHFSSYVDQFPDSCVGQFRRCYELQTQQAVFKELLCRKGGRVPKGTTHVSVDCTADAAASKKTYEKYKKRRTFRMVLRIGIPVLLLLCCAGGCSRYRLKLSSFAKTCQEKWNNSSNSKGHDDWTICSVMCCGILFVMKRLHKTSEMSGLLDEGNEIQLGPVDDRISRRSAAAELA